MKKKKLNRLLKLEILLFGIFLFTFSCQKGDEQFQTTKEVQTNSNIKVSTLYKAEIEKDKRLINKIGKLQADIKSKRTSSLSNRDVYNAEHDFTINTNYAKHIDNGIKHTYTFPFYREQDNGLLENLLLVEQDDTSFKTYIVQYEFTEEEIIAINFKQPVDIENKVTFIEINDNGISSDVLGKYYYNGSCYEDNYVYQASTNCLGSDHHSYSVGAECPLWGTINTATSGGYVNIPTLVSCDSGGGGGGTSPDYNPTNPNDNPHGGGTSGSSTTPITCRTCPVLEDPTEVDSKKECEKIKKQLEDNPLLIPKLKSNKLQTNLLKESGFTVFDDSNTPIDSSVGADGAVELEIPNDKKLIVTSHTHNSPATETYSVPSWADIVDGLVTTTKDDLLDPSKFVGFLFTADSTSYAYTISDISAFNKFWARPGETGFDFKQALERAKLMKDYYAINEPDAKPLIKENSADNDVDLKHFLDLINDNSMGISLFEESDNFTTFKKLTHNKTTNSIDKNSCN